MKTKHKISETAFLLLCILVCNVSSAQALREISLNEDWKFRKSGDSKWLKAYIPGSVHTDLLKNKLIPDPFSGENEKEIQWIENETWEYERTLKISEENLSNTHIELCFSGLDTYADVFLNDSVILHANNMFRTWDQDVKKYLHNGNNSLRILFYPATKKGKELSEKLSYKLPGGEKVFARKAQYQYGWDWGPRFVTCGIYKSVSLKYWNDARIINSHIMQKSITDSLAELDFETEIQSDAEGDLTLGANQYLIGRPGNAIAKNSEKKFHLKPGINHVHLTHQIPHPQRWWPNGAGEQVLYPFTIYLSKEDSVIDELSMDIGLRTIELIQNKDKAGKGFYFKINGEPMFMKGANWIPTDNFVARTSFEKYDALLLSAKEANMNMLRVWGGGIYESDEFYKLCDQYGILVWQDFMFACAMYPGDPDFIENVSIEVTEQIQRLRNYSCLALWCGNNEIDEGWKNWGWQKEFNYSQKDSAEIWTNYLTLFRKTLPEIISVNDPETAYWQSSPEIGWGHKESLKQGDSHYWGVWWGMEPFENYEKKVGRFVSEYGFQGMPALSTIKKFSTETEPSLKSASVTHHQKHPTGFQTIQTYMERDFRVPKKFEDYVYVSQLLQAEGMKTAMEAHRRAKPVCMGTLYWQLNDCWPVTSWSSIDYYGTPKALHYQAKASFENILVCVEEKNDSLYTYVVSDLRKTISGTLKIELQDFSGKILLTDNHPADIPPNSSLVYVSSNIEKLTGNKSNLDEKVFIASFTSENVEHRCIHYFVKPKDLKLQKPNVTLKNIGENTFEITTDKLAKNILLESENEGDKFSDNFFDLLAGEKHIVSLYSKKKNKTIKIKTLIDTY